MLIHTPFDVIEALVSSLLEIDGPIVVMAGHFALVHDRSGSLVPGIPEEIEDEELRRFVSSHHYMGRFPSKTWNAGVEIVRQLRAVGRDAKLLILINDWQHVRPALDGQRNEARDSFFAKAEIPNSFRRALLEAGLSDSVLLADARDGKECVFWSESKLRGWYNRHLRSRVVIVSECAQEWVPLLVKLEDLECAAFAAFVPGSCRAPVVGGTETAEEILEIRLKVSTIFPGTGEEFWENTWIENDA